MSRDHFFNRRNFLKQTALAGLGGIAYLMKSPQQLLAEVVYKNAFSMASAEAAGVPFSRNYVNIMMPGGPNRYGFDHWLRTKPDENQLVYSPSVATGFTYDANGVVTGTEYKSGLYKDYLVPQVFFNLSASERSQFLDSFLIVRGYGSGIDGHEQNIPLQLLPLLGLPSLSGHVADLSPRPYQAVKHGISNLSASKYFSKKSIGLNILSATTPLSTLLAPLASVNSIRTLRKQNEDLFYQLRSSLNATSESSVALKIASASLESSYQLLQRNFGSFATDWTNLVAEYKSIIEAAVRSTAVKGVNTSLDGSQSLQAVSDGKKGSDLATRGPFQFTSSITFAQEVWGNGADIAQTADVATITFLAEGLALAEYCISRELSSSVEIMSGYLDKIRLTVGGPIFHGHFHDSHTTGAYAETFMRGLYYTGLVAGLLYFKSKLQASGHWNQTLVHLVSDFDRSVDASGYKSDHGFNQMIASVFSGVLAGGPYVVGNVYRQKAANEVSQGVAAPINGYPVQGAPSPATMASTVAELISTENNPWKNTAPSLVKLNPDGTLSLPFGRGKLV